MSDIQDIISNLRKKYEQSYGFAVFDLAVEEEADRVVVRGKVLTENQKAEAISELEKASGKRVKDDIRVLSDSESEGIGWAIVVSAVASQKSRFVSNKIANEKILKRIGASQIRKGDVLRVLAKKEDQILGQSGDMTLGWTDLKDVEMKDISLRQMWLDGIAAKSGEIVHVTEPKGKLIEEAEKYLGVRYVLGANSEEGIDCSGFMQSVYRRAFGIVLPKHSWDQKKMGLSLDLKDAETGDLVFMMKKEKGTKHVGIWEKTESGNNLIHASLSMDGVVRQSADEVFAEYEVADVRKIVSDK